MIYHWMLVAQICVGSACTDIWERGPYKEALDCQAAARVEMAKPDRQFTRLVCAHKREEKA